MMKKLVIAIAMLIPSFGAGYSAFAAAPAHEQHIQVNKNDKELLARLVSAEAKGEPYAGKVAVATVVLNRVDSSKFPDTVKALFIKKVSTAQSATVKLINLQTKVLKKL